MQGNMVAAKKPIEDKPQRLHDAITGVRGIARKLATLKQDITLAQTPPTDRVEKEAEPVISLQYVFDNAADEMAEYAIKIITTTAEISNIVVGSSGEKACEKSNATDVMKAYTPERIYDAFCGVRGALATIKTLKEEIEGAETPVEGEDYKSPSPSVQYILDELPDKLDKETVLAESCISDIRMILGV